MLYHLAKHLVSVSLVSFGLLAVILSLVALLRICRRPILKLPTATLVALSLFAVISAGVADKMRGSGQAQDEGLLPKVLHGDSTGELGAQPRAIPNSMPLLPDACDVGEDEGFADMPCVSNLMVAAIRRGSNETANVVAWHPSFRPLGDLVDFYGGTNLTDFARLFTLNVAQCASNALVVVSDEDVSGMDCNAQGFFAVGDATDTDGDGLSDSDECLIYKTNPAGRDTDGDYVPDGEEVAIGSSPLVVDTDGDGINDGDEAGYVYTTVGPMWQQMVSYMDITLDLATGNCHCASCELPVPAILQGKAVTNVTVSANGVIFFNDPGYVNYGQNVQAYDFSRTIDVNALVVAPFSDSQLFLKTNSTVLVGKAVFVGGDSACIQYNNIGRIGAGSETNNVSFEVFIPGRVNAYDAIIIYKDIVGDAMDGRNAGVGIQSFGGRSRRSISYMEPGSVYNYKVHMLRVGTDSDPANPDTDGDGLTDGEEISAGLSPHYVDTDRDGLPDGWELSYGLDPLSTNGDNGAAGDFDGDGLSNLDEYLNGTDPSDMDGDTDNDEVSDVTEVQQGSDPTNAADGGIPPDAAQYRELEFNINGDYAAWEMKIEGLGPDDMRVRKISMGAPNAANTTNVKVRKGNAYRLTMRWLNCDGHNDKFAPWYCWQAKIDGLPQTQSYQSYSDIRLSGNEVVVGNGWIAENADGLLTAHVDECTYDDYGNPRPGNVAGGLSATLYVLGDPVLVFDYDRDGAITDAEAAIARAGTKTFRFWVNDDNDSGDINSSANDIPGSGPNYANEPEYNVGMVNGRGDILDFTPVWIDTTAVFPPVAPYAVRSSVKWKIRSGVVNVVWSRKNRIQAGLFHRADQGQDFGSSLMQELRWATVENAVDGALVPSEMLSDMLAAPDFDGVFLIEGCAAGTNLVVEGWFGEGNGATKIVEGAANVRISSVEDMYRHLNTRGLSDENVTWIPSVGDPTNRPDSETSSTNLVFLHGANVSQQDSRAWASEVFKRMWQSGMTAKFTAVSWRSNIGPSWNYQENVSNAFFTASVLAPQIAPLPGTKVLMAHSLGNMVCSAMIQDYGLQVSKYLMCNSAVPSEAYEATRSTMAPQLVHEDWELYFMRTLSSEWHTLFAAFPNDDRRKLGWPGRFVNVAQYAVNFYSTGDEVLELAVDNDVSIFTGITDSFSHHSWHKQELFKGKGGIGGTDWSGWNSRCNYTVANARIVAELRENPVFNPFPESITNSVIPRLVIDAHLAQGIPALTVAAGVDIMESVFVPGKRFDLNSLNDEYGVLRPNGWPDRSSYQGRWCHSDIKDVAYFFNFKFYDKAIEKGGLK